MVKTAIKDKKQALGLLAKTLVYAFAIFGLIFIVILLAVLGMMAPSSKFVGVPERAVLTIDFDENYAELRGDDFFAEFYDESVYSIFDVVRAITIAADDDRIQAISANISHTSLGFAQTQDIIEAIKYFRSRGKKAYIFSTGMGSFGLGNREYFLASAFDEIWLQPNSDIGLTGINIEVPFFKNTLNKVGVTPEFYSRYEYKTAINSVTEKGITPAYKEELNRLGKGLFRSLEIGIALNRDLDAMAVETLINQAPIFAEDAVANGLADKLSYRSDMNAFLTQEYNAELFDIGDYMGNIIDLAREDVAQIAVLVLDGVIENGESFNNPVKNTIIGSQTVLRQLDELRQLDNLRALILRINSPGGSYSASNEIWYALNQFKKEKQIPIIVSMSDYAASGGYFIALAGDLIIAQDATLTGSIGVFGGKVVLADLWKKIGVNWEEIKFGKNAGILSTNHKFTPSEKAVFERSLDRIYDDFTSKVAAARNINAEDMDKVARGRVWLGGSATLEGLVDELGGYLSAIERALALSGISLQDDFDIVYYPRRQSIQEKITKFLESGGGLPMLKAVENSGIDMSDFNLLYRLRHEAILPPFKVEM